ncbi:MAG: glycosyltransferase [Candidatus Entotheonellia bacterium]
MNGEPRPLLSVISRSFPPQVSGSAIILANLLSQYPGDAQAIAGYSRYTRDDPMFQPPCPTQDLGLPRRFPRLYEQLRIRFPALVSRSLKGSMGRRLSRRRGNVVLAAFPYADFTVAAFLAARSLQLPFYVHMHDLWSENTDVRTAGARFAQQWEPVILKGATRVLCMTEAMQEHYEKKYGIQTELLPHSIQEQNYQQAPTEICPPRLPHPTVLFVGSVSPPMNLDALQVLAGASELFPPGYQLLYCTPMDLATLRRLGISSSRLRARYVSRAEVQRLQSEAHVLVAPLSHKHCSEEEVRTVFSTKLLEYLVSGRPIVVFAPEGSYHADSARKRGWGYVVTEDSCEALAAAIVKVATDTALAAGLVRNALQEARNRDARRYAEQLHSWVLADTQISRPDSGSNHPFPPARGKSSLIPSPLEGEGEDGGEAAP